MEHVQVLWIVLMVIFLAIEAIAIGLTSLWFAIGAAVALIASFFGAEIWLQVVLFLVVSVAAIAMTRPLAMRYVNSRTQKTNADAVVGQEATVTERIDNIRGTGLATVGGRLWTARSITGQVIEPGTRTKVMAIEGVKILVAPERVYATSAPSADRTEG